MSKDKKQDLINTLYNTKLSALDNIRYNVDKLKSPQFRNDSGYDYDLRGYWEENRTFPKNGHLPDTYKKPNHITFSADSKYSNGNHVGGTWQQNNLGSWQFTPSTFNLSQYSPEQYIDYFNRFEQGNNVILPSN